jgi:hypothetical protein
MTTPRRRKHADNPPGGWMADAPGPASGALQLLHVGYRKSWSTLANRSAAAPLEEEKRTYS